MDILQRNKLVIFIAVLPLLYLFICNVDLLTTPSTANVPVELEIKVKSPKGEVLTSVNQPKENGFGRSNSLYSFVPPVIFQSGSTLDNALFKNTTKALNVCILSMDIYGLSNSGGTALAYWNLANTLSQYSPSKIVGDLPFQVKLLVVLNSNLCKKLSTLYSKHSIDLVCIGNNTDSTTTWEFANTYLQSGIQVLEWLKENDNACNVLHSHEWGGVLGPILSARLLPNSSYLPKLIITETHGGHMWSMLTHAPHKPTDLIASEVDYYERKSLEDADQVISPTHYMLSYFHERGWIPKKPLILPMVIQEKKPIYSLTSSARNQPPTRIVFYSRKEDRKGLHVFVRGLDMLTNRTAIKTLNVEIMAPDDSAEIQHRINRWKEDWNVQIRTSESRSRALEVITSEAAKTLAVVTSFAENAAEVLAECEVAGVRTIVLDLGGLEEMLQVGTVVKDMSSKTLGTLLVKVLTGEEKAEVPQLSKRVKESPKKWIEWHRIVKDRARVPTQEEVESGKVLDDQVPVVEQDGFKEIPVKEPSPKDIPRPDKKPEKEQELDKEELEALEEEETNVAARKRKRDNVSGTNDIKVRTITFSDPDPNPLSLYETLCSSSEQATAFLILPDGFNLIEEQSPMETLTRVLINHPEIAAVTAGIEYLATSGNTASTLAHGPFFFARTSGQKCLKTYPVMVRKNVFCTHYTAEARSFSRYESWHLFMLLEQGNAKVGTLPIALFDIDEDVAGVWDECSEDFDPLLRMAKQGDYVIVNIMNEAAKWRIGNFIEQDAKRGMISEEHVLADNLKDFNQYQGNNGWEYLYRATNGPKDVVDLQEEADVIRLEWHSEDERWICPVRSGKTIAQFPFIGRTGLHSCIGRNKGCCVEGAMNSAVLRWKAHKFAKNVKARLHMQLVDSCGDGVEATLRTGLALRQRHTSILTTVDVVKLDRGRNKSNGRLRNRIQRTYDLGDVWPGDVVELQLDPRETLHCDTTRIWLQIFNGEAAASNN